MVEKSIVLEYFSTFEKLTIVLGPFSYQKVFGKFSSKTFFFGKCFGQDNFENFYPKVLLEKNIGRFGYQKNGHFERLFT